MNWVPSLCLERRVPRARAEEGLPYMRAQLTTLGLVLGLVCASPAAGSPVTWQWSGPVTGYTCYNYGVCDTTAFAAVVPLGTTVDVFLTFNDESTTYNPPASCLWGYGSATFQVLGRTYTSQAWLWNNGMGFDAGVCGAGGNEVVVPGWGNGGPPLPDGWILYPSSSTTIPGMNWGLDLSWTMPSSINPRFPAFRLEGNTPARFTVDLQAVPEPSTWLLLGTGLAAVAARRFGLMRRR